MKSQPLMMWAVINPHGRIIPDTIKPSKQSAADASDVMEAEFQEGGYRVARVTVSEVQE